MHEGLASVFSVEWVRIPGEVSSTGGCLVDFYAFPSSLGSGDPSLVFSWLEPSWVKVVGGMELSCLSLQQSFILTLENLGVGGGCRAMLILF